MRKLLVFVLVATLLGGGGYWYLQGQSRAVSPTSEQIKLVAATSGCYGAGCNGKSPAGLCDDGKTVGAIHAEYGMLELRYSPSCKSNWGRFTTYNRYPEQYDGYVVVPRITAWNPGEPSYGTAKTSFSLSSWSLMVDGTKTACTGVEIFLSRGGGFVPEVGQDEWTYRNEEGLSSRGWKWGPCR